MKTGLVLLFCFLSILGISQTSYVWNGTTSGAWNTSGNWTPNGIPGSVDNVTIVSGANTCNLHASISVTNLTVTSGTLNLGGFTLNPTGNATFTSGTVNNGTINVTGGTGNTATLTNTSFAATTTLNITTGAINVNGGTYAGPVNLNQTGSSNNTGTGNATFNGSLTITNSGTGYFRMNGNCTYNGTTTLNNTGSGYLLPELTTGSTYNGNLNINNSSALQHIRLAYAGNTNYNGNIVITNTGASNAGVYFCELTSASANLANGKTISIGGAGFSSGPLNIQRFTQTGSVAQNLALTGTAALTISNNCTFNGNLNIISPNIYVSQSIFNGTTTLTKTSGATSNTNNGGNTFNGDFTINYTSASGTGYISFGYNAKDIFNGNVYSNNNSLDRIIFCHNSANNEFNGNIYLTQTGSSLGTALAWNAGSTSTLASGKTIQIGGAGYNTGWLYIQGLTQLGSAPVSITTTGTSSVNIGEGNTAGPCTFGGAVDITAPDIYVRGGMFNGATSFTKTGGVNNHNNGRQNIFNSTLSINQQSTSGYFTLSYNSADQFNDDITVTNTGTQGIAFGWTNGSGTPVLASGKTITIGGGGFSGGFLRLSGFTQNGAAPMNLTLTGTAAFYIDGNPSACVLNGSLNVTAPDIYIRGGIFNAPVTCTKTGGVDNHNNGNQNIFNSTLAINQQSTSGYFMLGYNSNEKFNDDVIVTNTGTQAINLGYNGGTGTPEMAAGKTVIIGGAGFSGGILRFSSFTQNGSAPINLNLTGTAVLYIQNTPAPCIFGGAFTASAPNLYIQGGTFNGATSFTKTGGVDNNNGGNQNIFNSTLEINQQSTTGYFMLGYNSNDLFNDNITVTNTGTQNINLGYTGGTGTPTLAAGKTILVGGAGFSGGTLLLGTFTQLGNTAITLPFTGSTTSFRITGNSIIGGNLTLTAPEIYFNGATFNGTVNATKTGNGQWSNGGNTFNGTLTINNTGGGYFGLANGTADVYNGDVITNNSGSERILFGNGAITLQFNGNIILSESGTAIGTGFSYGNTTNCVQAAGKTISISGGYSSGYLYFERFTQLGTGSINLSLSAGANYLRFGPNSNFGGNIVCDAPRIFFNSSTFGGTVDATKTGGADDYSTGGNTFASTVKLTHTGTTAGYFGMGGGADDIFNGDLYLTNTGTERILLAMGAGVHNSYNGNIIVSQSSTATGIALVWNSSSTATIAAGKTIMLGAGGFSGGYLYTRYVTQLGNTAVNLPMTGTSALYFGPGTTIGGNVVSTSGSLYFNGCTFSGTVDASKNDVGTNNSDGGNIFNGVTTITNNGSGQFLLGNVNADVFNAATTFNHYGDYRFYFANNHTGQTTTFASDLNLNVNKSGGTDSWAFMVCEGTSTAFTVAGNFTLNVAGSLQSNCRFLNASSTSMSITGNSTISISNTHNSTTLQMGVSGTSTYNGNIIVSNTGGGTGGGIFFNVSASATATLANTRTITLGAGGFATGTLSLIRFTQIGGTAQNLVQTSGTSSLVLGPNSAFGGNVTFNFPQVYLNGTNYSGTTDITKNGATDNAGNGGNTFNGVTTITNSGSGYLMTGNVNADQFNANTTFNNTGTYRIYFAHNHGGQTTTFASDLTINSAKSGGTDGYSYFIAEGNNANVLFNGPVNINITGSINSTIRTLQGTGTTAVFNGPLTITIPNSHASTTVFAGASGTTTYNNNITVSNTGGSAGIYFNYNASATSTLANTRTISLGAGGFTSGTLSLVRFTQTGATPQTLSQTSGTAALYLGPTSSFDGNVTFSFPQVYLNSATYNGTANITKNGTTNNAGTGGNIFNGTTIINNSSDSYLMTGNTTRDQFNAVTTFNNTGSNRIYFAYNHTGQTTTFSNNVTINSAKTSGTDQYSYLICEGSNTSVNFGGNVTINNSGSIRSDIRLLAGNTTTATFNGDLNIDLSNTNSSTQIILGNTGTTTYNGNITMSNTGAGSSGGIFFNLNSTASSTLATTKSIALGTGGFAGGTLSIIRFTQLGSAVQTLNQTSGTGRLILGPSVTFNGDVNFNFPQVFLNGGTYNATATIEKNGATDNDCNGGNTFNLTTTITNSHNTARFRMANTTADIYNGSVTFVQNNAGVLAPNYNTNCSYNGDVTVFSTGTYTITFGSGGSGIATFGGSNAQSINKSGTAGDPVFTRLVMSKTSNDVTLNTRINISTTLTMTQGLINTTQTNILNMNNASTSTLGNASSFINGPMNYDMAVNNTTRTLNMPVGKGSDWRPVVLTVRHSAATSYTYNSEVFNASAVQLGYTLPATIDTVSSVHYWNVHRYITGTSTPASNTNLSYSAGAYPVIQLYFGTNDFVYDGNNLTIVKNTTASPTTWTDIGGTSAIGVNASPVAGSVTSTSSPSAFNSFSTFTLGSRLSGLNPLPVEFVSFEARQNGNNTDLTWTTAHEENSNYFAIEHSINGTDFTTISTKEAVHYSNSYTSYSDVHTSPVKGINYYRITEFDNNNSTTVSSIQSVLFISNGTVSFYPNPAKDLLLFKSSDENPVKIELINLNGQVIYNMQFNGNGSINLKDLNTAEGLYMVRLIKDGETETARLIIEK